MISTPLTVGVVVADIALTCLAVAAIAYVAAAERREAAKPAGPLFAVAAALVVGWFVTVLLLARNGVFETTPTTAFPPVIAFGIIVPIIVGTALIVALPGFRARVARIPLHWLVGVQLYRVVGVLFLIAYLQDEMPAEFALPAGIGDVLVGLAAPFVAHKLATQGPARARSAVLAWCALGILDLVVAVGCGFLSAPSSVQQLALDAPNAAITSYPFVLIPTFAVPLSVLLHIYVIARLPKRSTAARSAVGGARTA